MVASNLSSLNIYFITNSIIISRYYFFYRGNLNVTNGKVTGLGTFRLENFRFSKGDLSLDIEVTIPMIKFEAGNV